VTRLSAADIVDISSDLTDYDAELVRKTGYSLTGVACRAAGISESRIRKILPELSIGVIPVTGGQGIISGFGATLANIISHMGGRAFVAQAPDVAGMAQAFEEKADIIMLADDDCFVAVDIQSRRVVDNAKATGKAFATGMHLMVGDLSDRRVLVLGCGPVGSSAAEALVRIGARVSVFDINRRRCSDLAQAIKLSLNAQIHIEQELDAALNAHRLIVDASPAADIIDAGHITTESYISAPGVPCGLSAPAISKVSDRLLHDPLQFGVATMLVDAVKYRLEHE
jgi:pyrrolysine biosynthesis protein PylD